MKKRIGWLLLSLMMSLTLVLASCGPAEEAEEEEAVTEEEEAVTGEEEAVTEEEEEEIVVEEKEEPQYGGNLNLLFNVGKAPRGFDEGLDFCWSCSTSAWTLETLQEGDWTKGLLGTGEMEWSIGWTMDLNNMSGVLAESWDMEPGKITWHIRKGVHFHNKPPTNGREMNAHDIEYCMHRSFETPTSTMYLYYTPPPAAPPGRAPTAIYCTDDWTVVMEVPELMTGFLLIETGSEQMRFYSPDVIEEYGNMSDWENVCGTGPFELTEYIPQSAVTLTRNPDYWQYDPFYPENRLPYVDTLSVYVVDDPATRMAALRGGKVDQLQEQEWRDSESLQRTNPELKYRYYSSARPQALWCRLDKPELPWYDIRVRQAVHMAIDHETIKEGYYGGHADILGYPVGNTPALQAVYVPIEECNAEIQELFSYNPGKARELLSEAGYPNGFTDSILIEQKNVSLMSIIQSYLDDVGVHLDIKVVEDGAFSAIWRSRTHESWIFNYRIGLLPWEMSAVRASCNHNLSIVDDPYIEDMYWESMKRAVVDMPAWFEWYSEFLHDYILEHAWMVQTCSPEFATFWQPWLKNYNGERNAGYYQNWIWAKRVWIDQDLKKSMGH